MPHAACSRAVSPSSRHCASRARTRSRVSRRASAGTRPGSEQAAVYSRSARRSSSSAPRRSPRRRRSSAAACNTLASTARSRTAPGCAAARSAAYSASRSSSASPWTSHRRRTQREYSAHSSGSASGCSSRSVAPRSSCTASIRYCTMWSDSKCRSRTRALSTAAFGVWAGPRCPFRPAWTTNCSGRGMNRSSTRTATSAKGWGTRGSPIAPLSPLSPPLRCPRRARRPPGCPWWGWSATARTGPRRAGRRPGPGNSARPSRTAARCTASSV